MRLIELSPLWLTLDGRRVGFMFRCPINRKEWQTCFFEKFPVLGGTDDYDAAARVSQFGIVRSSGFDGDLSRVQPCNENAVWTCDPAPHYAAFETISIKPSLDGSRGGNWHGFITNGNIVGGIPND